MIISSKLVLDTDIWKWLCKGKIIDEKGKESIITLEEFKSIVDNDEDILYTNSGIKFGCFLFTSDSRFY